jgi:hypothetical protein
MSRGTADPRKKKGQFNQTSGRNYARLKRARTGFEPRQAVGRQPFMPNEYLLNACLSVQSLRLRPCERMRPLSVGALSALHPATDYYTGDPIFCKGISEKSASGTRQDRRRSERAFGTLQDRPRARPEMALPGRPPTWPVCTPRPNAQDAQQDANGRRPTSRRSDPWYSSITHRQGAAR